MTRPDADAPMNPLEHEAAAYEPEIAASEPEIAAAPEAGSGNGRFARETSWALALEVIGLLGTMVSFALLGRTLGPSGYGGYASLYAIVGPMVSLAVAGVVLSFLQHSIREREPLAATARSCLSLSLGLGTLLTIVASIIAVAFIDSLSTLAMVTLLATELLTTPIVLIASAVIQASSGFAGAAKMRIIFSVARTTVLLTLFAAGSLTVVDLGVWSLVSSTIIATASLALVGRRYGFDFRPGRMRLRHFKTTVVYSVGISAFSFSNDGDKVVLAANKFTVDTGLYAAAYRIVQLGSVPIGAVSNASHARFLQNSGVEHGEHLRRAVRYATLTGAYGAVFGVAVMLMAPLLPIFMGDDFEGSVQMVRWLAPLVMVRSLVIFPLNALMGLGKTTLRTVLIIVNAIVVFVLYIVFIPRFGWKGAAALTLIGELLMAVMTWTAVVLCQRAADRRLVPTHGASGSATPAT